MREIYRITVRVTSSNEPGDVETVEWYADRIPDEGKLVEAAAPFAIGEAAVQRLQLDDTPDACAPLIGWRMSKAGETVGATIDPTDARLNELERSQRNTERALGQILALLNAPKISAGHNAAVVHETYGAAPEQTAGVVAPRRPGRVIPTEDMNPNEDPRSGSMGVVGVTPVSAIFSPGVDREGKGILIPQPPSVVGDSLRKPFR